MKNVPAALGIRLVTFRQPRLEFVGLFIAHHQAVGHQSNDPLPVKIRNGDRVESLRFRAHDILEDPAYGHLRFAEMNISLFSHPDGRVGQGHRQYQTINAAAFFVD